MALQGAQDITVPIRGYHNLSPYPVRPVGISSAREIHGGDTASFLKLYKSGFLPSAFVRFAATHGESEWSRA